MYEIKPQSIKTFVEDSSIKLPRFQRKQTWDDKRNFELCISIFKEFPMGVCILNIELINGRETKWLLDGRQRRNALTNVWNDPEEIYAWAKKWLKIKNNDQINELEDKFWEKIHHYLEDDLDDNTEMPTESNDTVSEIDEEYTTESLESEVDISTNGLNLLLEIIKLVHNKSKRFTGFTRPFDFTDILPNLPYEVNIQGVRILNSKRLKAFLNNYEAFCSIEGLEKDSKDSFIKFMTNQYQSNLNKDVLNKLKLKINTNWVNISARIELVDKIKELLTKAEIGLIEVRNIPASDSQKIFNIINSQGTTLNAVEVLSAKPSWNIVVTNTTLEQKKYAEELYERIGIKNTSEIVRWDLPATIIKRFKNPNLFYRVFTASTGDFEKQLTLGFKLIAGVHENNITKDSVDNLTKNPNLIWETDIEKIITDVNTLTDVILSSNYFQYLNSWKFSMLTFLSDFACLNFNLLIYKDFKRKANPIGTSLITKQFQKNAFILFDRVVFEYAIGQWKGSGDSRVGRNLTNFAQSPDILQPIDKERWVILLTEIIDSNTINSEQTNLKVLTPILYHIYSVLNKLGPDSNTKIEVEHILPKTMFQGSANDELKSYQNNLTNLSLLPKKENISKNDQKLKNIDNPWLKDQIVKYCDIPESDFDKYSKIESVLELKELRKKILLNKFITERENILNN